MQAPACANCTRREELCEYPARLEATDASNEPSGSDATVVPSEWDEEARLQLLAQRIQDERMSSMLVSNDRYVDAIGTCNVGCILRVYDMILGPLY